MINSRPPDPHPFYSWWQTQGSVCSRIPSRSLHVTWYAKHIDCEDTSPLCWRVRQQLVISYIVEKVQLIAGRLHSETRLPIVWLEDPRKLSKELIVTKCSLSKFQGKFPRITEETLGNYSSWATSSSPGHNQIWIYDVVTHICKMAPTQRNTREGHFQARCCA